MLLRQRDPEHQLIGALMWLAAAQARPIVELVPDSAVWRPLSRWAYETIRRLVEAGVDVKWAPKRAIYHQKTITASDSTAAVGTGNLTRQYYSTSRDAWVLDSNPAHVAAVAATFVGDYTAPPSGHPPAATAAPNLIWSPAARASFLQRIEQAAHSVDVTSEELKDRAVLSALDHAAGRGVNCRIVLNDNPAWAGAVAEVSSAGCSVHPLPAAKTTRYMHEKILLTDNTSLVIGSQNLSTASLKTSPPQAFRKTENCRSRWTHPLRLPVSPPVESTFDADFAAAPAP